MTQIDQLHAVEAAAPGAPGGAAVPAWRARRIGGVDAVAGDPPVPLLVWYPLGPDGPVTAGMPGGWPAELARQTVAGLVSPGDLVVDVNGDDAVRVAAIAEQCRYVSLGGEAALRPQPVTKKAARLVTLRWPRPPASPAVPVEDDLLVACRRLLAADGRVAAVVMPPAGDGPFVDPAGSLLAAAHAAGLGYLQHIVRLDQPPTDDRLTAEPPRSGRPRPAPMRHWRVHRDVVVLVLRAGRRG